MRGGALIRGGALMCIGALIRGGAYVCIGALIRGGAENPELGREKVLAELPK